MLLTRWHSRSTKNTAANLEARRKEQSLGAKRICSGKFFLKFERWLMCCCLLLLKQQSFVAFQIAHVNFRAFLQDVRVLSKHKPPHVREEKSPLSIVRICVGVGVFVMHSMIPYPIQHWLLSRYSLKENQNVFQCKVRVVRLVRE